MWFYTVKTLKCVYSVSSLYVSNLLSMQVEGAKGFLAVLRDYLDTLCSNLRSHTITNVQSNNDKVCSPAFAKILSWMI
jgi:hypothetical protein